MPAFGLRDIMVSISPPWKASGIFEKLDYAMMLVADEIIEKVDQAIAARIPTRTKTTTSLALIGADRLIPQGLIETTVAYAIRLQRAYDDWKLAGTSRAVMAQLFGYLSPIAQKIETVSNSSVWDTMPFGSSSATVPSHTPQLANVSPTANWNWDATSDPDKTGWWWRVWLILFSDGGAGSTWVSSGGTWGDGSKWGSSSNATAKSWGLNVTSDVISSIRAIAKLWKPKHAWLRWIIVNFDPAEFGPTDAPGAGTLPDGRWGYWSKIDTVSGQIRRTKARYSGARYCDGAA